MVHGKLNSFNSITVCVVLDYTYGISSELAENFPLRFLPMYSTLFSVPEERSVLPLELLIFSVQLTVHVCLLFLF